VPSTEAACARSSRTCATLVASGQLQRGLDGGPTDGFGNQPPLDSTWRVPEDAGDVRLWLAARRRGGLA
jgi:hypothetical protein